MKHVYSRILILALVAILCPLAALGETSIIVDQYATKEIDAGERVSVEDLLSFVILGHEFNGSFYYFHGAKNVQIFNSGADHQNIVVSCSILNESTSPLTYSKHIKDVKVVFRDKFFYEALLGQTDPNASYISYPYLDAFSILPLVEGYPCFIFKVPNFIETSDEPLILQLTIDGQPYMCRLR